MNILVFRKMIITFLLFLTVLFSNIIYAQTIKKIIVQGNRLVSSEAIEDKMLNQVGRNLDISKVSFDIESIFDLGFFDDVKIYKETKTGSLELVVVVHEKPIISSIVFEGNDDVDTDDLEEEMIVKPYMVLDMTAVMETEKKLLDFYEEKGFYLATIEHSLRKADKDAEIEAEQLELIFYIKENSKIKVKEIRFLGNEYLSDTELKKIMQTKENGVFSWLTGSGNYRESIVDIDRERVSFYYSTVGFPMAKVSAPITSVSEDKQWIYLTYRVNEGEKYTFAKATVETDNVLFSEEFLKENLIINKDKGALYNSLKIKQQMDIFQNMYGDKGFAYTNVIPVPSYNKNNKTVKLNFKIDKGRKVYFNKFTVVGNHKTRDKVVRRELKIYEGELYHHSNKEKSKRRIMALGYFDDVSFRKRSIYNRNDNKEYMDIDIVVKEKSSTGQFMLSMGYSTYEGFVTMAQVQEHNFLGYGQTVTLRTNISKISTLYYLGFYDPYFLDSDWSFGVDLYREERMAESFTTLRTGGNIRFGYHLTDFTKLYLTYKLEDSETSWSDTFNGIFDADVEDGFTSSVTLTLERDKRNNRLDTSAGSFQSLSSELAGLGGNKYYIKTMLDLRYYYPFMDVTTLKTRLLLANITGYTPKGVPYSERFLMGGVQTLRGFDYYSLGPTKAGTDGIQRTVGGLNEIVWNVEWEFPILRPAGLRGVLFFDAGNAFDNIVGLTTDIPLRANVGFGIRWHSPMGPLRFEWGIPIIKKAGEAGTVFQFMIGQSF